VAGDESLGLIGACPEEPPTAMMPDLVAILFPEPAAGFPLMPRSGGQVVWIIANSTGLAAIVAKIVPCALLSIKSKTRARAGRQPSHTAAAHSRRSQEFFAFPFQLNTPASPASRFSDFLEWRPAPRSFRN